LRIELGLAESRQVSGDGIFGVEPQHLRIGANEAFVEYSAGEHIEPFLLDGLQHAGADLGDVGNVIERKAAPLALFAKFFPECPHEKTSAGGKLTRVTMTQS
jgi:hypothetical protein